VAEEAEEAGIRNKKTLIIQQLGNKKLLIAKSAIVEALFCY
jgi:hypothetical protein